MFRKRFTTRGAAQGCVLESPARSRSAGLLFRGTRQEQVADDPGDDRTTQDADLRFGDVNRVGEGQAGDEERHREADAGENVRAMDLPPGDALGQVRQFEASPRARSPLVMPSCLPKNKTDNHAHRNRTGQLAEHVSLQGDAGIRERKDGQYHEGHRAVEIVLDALEGRLGMLDGFTHREDRCLLLGRVHARVFGQAHRLHAGGEQLETLHQCFAVDARGGRDHEGHQDGGNRRVDAGLEEGDPDDDSDHEVEKGIAYFETIHQESPAEDGETYPQGDEVDVRGVEHCDHEHRTDIVHNRQRGQKHLHAERHAIAEQRQYAEREGNVGSHGNTPTASCVRSVVERRVERRGDHHAAKRGNRRQRRFAQAGQFSHHQLAFDLQTDKKEEDAHQTIVDPMVHRVVEPKYSGVQVEVGFEDLVVGMSRWRVGNDNGDHRGQHEESCSGQPVTAKIRGPATARGRWDEVGAKVDWRPKLRRP